MSKSARVAWALLAFFAIGTGLVSLRYALPNVPFPSNLPNFGVRHGWLVSHAIFSSIALLVGPWQFLPAFRRRRLTAHRWTGRVYIAAVGAGWVTSLPVALHANAGPIASAGFLLLGACWIVSTAVGYVAIRQRRVQLHRRWMIRSYALTAAAITLRNYLPLLLIGGLSFPISYRIVAWACWVPNLLFAEWLIYRSAHSGPKSDSI